MKRPESSREIETLLRDDPFVVADWYGQENDDDICEPLVRALEDPSDAVRNAAVKALIGLDDLYAASSIFGVISGGSVPARKAAVTVLTVIGKGNALALRHLARAADDPDREVARLANAALAKMLGDPRVMGMDDE